MVRSFALTAGCDDGWMDGWVPSASNEEGALAKERSLNVLCVLLSVFARARRSPSERKNRATPMALFLLLSKTPMDGVAVTNVARSDFVRVGFNTSLGFNRAFRPIVPRTRR